MRNLDILAAENGEHVRVLLCGEEQSYVVSCQHFRMPYPVASDLLAELQPVPAEAYSVFVLDEDITNRQREGRNRKLDLIAPLLDDTCIYDKSHRNEVVRQIAAEHNIARRTVLQYLWRYWVYCEIHTAMQHCYGQYSVQSEAATFQNGYSLMHGNALAASIGGGNSFSVVGVSGLGKSTALQRVLSLYPQVIEHTEYHGQKFYCHQIPYLVVQTPHDASIKALILDIYLQIDSLIGTTYQKDALSRRLSIDVLVSQLNQIVRVNHIGLLVIDELQNITYHKSDGGIS